MWELVRILIVASGLRAVYEATRSSSRERLNPDTLTSTEQVLIPQTASQGYNLKGARKESKARTTSREVAEFTELPPQLRRQLLQYGSEWVKALYEPG